MKKLIIFTGILLVLTASTAMAQRTTATNTGRQAAQQARIAEGVRNRDLTRAETVRLEREQRKIQIEKRMAQSDGVVTPAEKRFLRREQRKASRHISRQKNDNQVRRR